MVIVGISGHLASGKDLAARWLIEHAGFQRLGFADALKAEVRGRLRRTLLAIYAESDYPADVPEWRKLDILLQYKPPIVRAFLQEYGTEVRRLDDPDYWVRAWWRRVEGLPPGSRVVAPDVRFRNEAESIMGAMIVHTERCYISYVLRIRRPEAGGSDHASERDLDDWPGWDAVIDNDGTVADLHARVERWAKSVGLVS